MFAIKHSGTLKLAALALRGWSLIVVLVNSSLVYAEATSEGMDWFRDAKQRWAKHIVFTTKHYGGFCKGDSALTDWDVMDQTEFKRDIVGEQPEACQATGIRLGGYYSIGDWHQCERSG